MALNKSAFLIRDYENIRQILREIYIYGCFSKADYIEKFGISGRKYDMEQMRINAYLPDGVINKEYVNKKVQLSCSYNIFDGAQNYLADTYRNKSFTELDIMAYFFIQQLLYEYEELTAPEILDRLPSVGSKVTLFTKDNLRVKLEELQERGVIKSRKDGKKVLYSLCEDCFADFDDEELLDLYTYLEFVKNVSPLEMPYYFLCQKVKMYLQFERNINTEGTEIVQFKHNHLFNSLDNDIMLEVLKAIRMQKTLKVIGYGFSKDNALELIPAEIIHDSTYGRQYLCGCDVGEGKRYVIRLDKIASLSCERELTEAEKTKAMQQKECSTRCWCTSDGNEQETSEIVIEFRFHEEKEDFILRRILTEGHGGSLQRKEVGVYEYCIEVLDPDEMIPWIRSFGERAKIISSGRKQTEKKLVEDWKKAVEKYEALR